ncbi:MAG: hypothetical protein Ct9H90mP8_1290 [Pseudomonadota bacterium]|nr:MAG: hypothetical protein Ct9H90mP8_1290 [Pseudomonadota bacterium]
MTKIIFDEGTKKVIGIGIVGPNAGELIAEGMLAIEMGADATDIGSTIHPHPTLSETLGLAAEAYKGKPNHRPLPAKGGNNPTFGHNLAASSAPSRIATFAPKPFGFPWPPNYMDGHSFSLKRKPKSSKGSCPAAKNDWSTSKS